jgi:hypothetical protein
MPRNALGSLGLTALALAGCQTLTQPGSVANASAKPVCLPSYMIDHTDIPNDTDPGSDTICSNLVTIHTNTDHNVCLLGEFTRVSSPARS